MYARELRKWSLKYQITYMWLTALVTMLLFIIYCPNAASMHLPNTNTALRIPSTDSSTYNWWLDKLSTSYTRSNRNIDSNINLNSNSNSNSNSDSSSNLSSRLSISNKNPLEVFSDFQNHNARAKARIRTRARARANATNTNTITTVTDTETTNTIYNNSNHQLHQQHQQQQQHNSNNNNYVPNVPNLNSQLNLNSYANSLTKNAYDYSTSTSDSDNDNDSSDRSNKLRRHTIQPNANYHSPVRVGGKSSSPPYTLLAHHHLPSSVHPLRYAIATFHVPPESLSSSSVVSALSQPSASTSASSSLPASISSTSSKSVKFDEHRRRMLLRQQAHNRTMLLAARSRRDSATLNSPLGFLRQSAATSTGNYNYQKHHHNRNSNHHNHRKRPRRYCSARDPAQLAFEAPTVIEGKIISMTSDRRANFSATVEVKKVFKQQIGYRLQGYLRLQFAYRNTSAECDIYREFLRPRGLVRGDELEQGRIYVMFVQQIDLSNFTILGQPIRKTRRVIEAVNNAVSENYAQLASIKSITASNRTVENGKELRIVCKVQGQPPPKVTWFKDHKSINRNRKLYQFIHYKRRSELIIKSFNSSDAGRYECRAKNKVNRDLQRRAIVIKAYPMPRYDAPTQQSGGQCPENAHEFCFNGGTCKFFTEIGSYSCICPEGFIGERCDRKEVNNMPPIPTYKTGYIADDPNVFDEDSAESELYESDEDDEDDDFTYPPTKDPFYNKFINSNKYI